MLAVIINYNSKPFLAIEKMLLKGLADLERYSAPAFGCCLMRIGLGLGVYFFYWVKGLVSIVIVLYLVRCDDSFINQYTCK